MPGLLYPVFLQVALTYALLVYLSMRRSAEVRSGHVSLEEVALNVEAYEDKTRAAGASYTNQFQLPILFYGVVALSLATEIGSNAMTGLAWVFVLMRIGHAWIHVTSNFVPRRALWFVGSAVSLLAMWAVFAFSFVMESAA